MREDKNTNGDIITSRVWALELELVWYLPHTLINFTKKIDFINLMWYCAETSVRQCCILGGHASYVAVCVLLYVYNMCVVRI